MFIKFSGGLVMVLWSQKWDNNSTCPKPDKTQTNITTFMTWSPNCGLGTVFRTNHVDVNSISVHNNTNCRPAKLLKCVLHNNIVMRTIVNIGSNKHFVNAHMNVAEYEYVSKYRYSAWTHINIGSINFFSSHFCAVIFCWRCFCPRSYWRIWRISRNNSQTQLKQAS